MRGRNKWERNYDRTNERDGETREKGWKEIMIWDKGREE
jgi:hypothetical protein